MNNILVETGFDIYEHRMSSAELAEKTLDKYYARDIDESDLPIDPFKILRKTGAIYIFQDLERLEGLYLLPQGSEEGFVAINQNRPIERQRFSAAHELCHHLKDNQPGTGQSYRRQGTGDPVEIYANQFASDILMPPRLFEKILAERKLERDDLEGVLIIANQFGVSFQAALIRISDLLKWEYSHKKVKKASRKFKPHKMRKELGIDNQLKLFKQVINSYNFEDINSPKKLKTDFLRYVIVADHEMENGRVSEERINEILVLIRMRGIEGLGEAENLNKDEMEVVGQHLMYESIFDKKDREPSLSVLKNFQRKLYSLTPFPEYAGKYRDASARINGTFVSTTQPRLIETELKIVCEEGDEIHTIKEHENPSELIKHIARVHHKITVIHPFVDGNGRTARALMNYHFIQSEIPPIYIRMKEKEEYIQGLKGLDSLDEVEPSVEPIQHFLIKKIIHNYSHFIPKY